MARRSSVGLCLETVSLDSSLSGTTEWLAMHVRMAGFPRWRKTVEGSPAASATVLANPRMGRKCSDACPGWQQRKDAQKRGVRR